MPISSTTRKAGPFIGNDTADTFPFAFKVFQDSDVSVVQSDGTTETSLNLTTDYTVALNDDQNANPGGSVTLTAGVLASGLTLVVNSAVPQLQGTDLNNQGGFYPEVITDALDRQTILSQQLQEQVDRSLKYPVSDPAADTVLPPVSVRANKVLGFDVDGLPAAVTVGEKGDTGDPGTAATITIGTVTTGAPGSQATVVNSGTSSAAILDIAIPAGTPGANGTGSGTVTSVSVGNCAPLFTSAVTAADSSPSVAFTLSAVATANKFLASPSGAGGNPSYRAIVGADLPAPASTTLGGVKSLAAASNKFLTSIGTDGIPVAAQPAFSNLSGSATAAQLPARTAAISYVIDGGGSVPTTGVKGQITVPTGCTITGWYLTADSAGSATINVNTSSYAGFPTTTTKFSPALSLVQKNSASGLSYALNAGDQVQFNLASVVTCTRLNLTLIVTIPYA